jgi:hypothetical protein
MSSLRRGLLSESDQPHEMSHIAPLPSYAASAQQLLNFSGEIDEGLTPVVGSSATLRKKSAQRIAL